MIAGLRAFASGARVAFVFLTRFPVASAVESPAARLWAAAHFPFVGGLLGLLGFGVWVVTCGWPATVRAWLVTIVLLMATGAFHEDGLADTADAMGGAFTRERLMVILKDSRIGSFGAVALVAGLGLRASILAELMPRSPGSLIAAQAISRFFPVVLMRAMPYVTAHEASRSHDVVATGGLQVVTAACWCACFAWLANRVSSLALPNWIASLALASALVALLAFRFHRRAGGLTGDFLGATQQIGEIALLLGLLVRLS